MEILIFENSGISGIEVRIDTREDGKEDLWLDQEWMARLFGVKRPAITKHIQNIYKNEEIDRDTCRSYDVITEKNGKKYRKSKNEYNLDVILSIGYRVNGRRGIEFRRWANEVLSKYLSRREGIGIMEKLFLAPESGLEKEGYVYLIESAGLFKIGRTKEIRGRFRSYATENPHPISVVHYYWTKDCISEEKRLHSKYGNKRVRHEWFRLDDCDLRDIRGWKTGICKKCVDLKNNVLQG